MNSQPELNIDDFFNCIITSFQASIEKIQAAYQSSESINESSHLLFENVHHSLSDLKKERDLLNTRLCETLAKNGSLRKKDYHMIMSGILDSLDEKERLAESQFLSFIQDQKETAQALKTSILGIKDIASSEAGDKITFIKNQLAQISKLQETRKESVLKTFLDFQHMHTRMMEYLEYLLEKGEHLQVKDIKEVKDQLINVID